MVKIVTENLLQLTFQALLVENYSNQSKWITRLYNIPKITFSTIYDYLVDRKLVIKKVACLESVVDKRAEAVCNNEEKVNVVEPSTNGVYQDTRQSLSFFSRRACTKH